MAQAASALTIAPRHQKPTLFNGTESAWRVLCDLYPAAETPEVVMAVVEYCAARKLDPFRRPVHVVPIWNAKLRRRVQVVMQGINEIETTASRTGAWAGMDLPAWGPDVTRTFRGTIEDDNGKREQVETTMRYPLWCAVTVWKMVAGQRVAFIEQLFWDESYGTASFRSEVPNSRWQKAPRQMLHKCTKAAVLRAAFPEQVAGYAAEEAEDREVDAGGITIDGHVDHGTAPDPRRTAPASVESNRASSGQDAPHECHEPEDDGLDEPNGTIWLRNLLKLLTAAETTNRVVELRGDPRVRHAITAAPTLIRQQIEDAFSAAHERLAPGEEDGAAEDGDPGETGEEWADDPIAGLLAEVERMDLITIGGLQANATWRGAIRNLLPPDRDRLDEAIEARKAQIKGAQGNGQTG